MLRVEESVSLLSRLNEGRNSMKSDGRKNKLQPLIDQDGEVRELTAEYFAKAKRGRPPMPESQNTEGVYETKGLAPVKSDE